MAPVRLVYAMRPTSVNPDQEPDTTATATLRATVTGRVQGVGFRLFVQNAARRLGLGGYVQNQYDDNTVYVLAHGRRDSLEQLLNLLWRGPLGARVTDVRTQWVEGTGTPETESPRFEVRH